MKCLSKYLSEVNPEPYQASKMELLVEIVKFSNVNFFLIKLHLRWLTGFWVYFPKIFRATFSKHLHFLTLPDVFFRNLVSNNVQSRWIIKC